MGMKLRPTSLMSLVLAFFLLGHNALLGQSKKQNKALLKDAKEHLRYEEYQQAIPLVEKLLLQDSENPYYNFWMGKSLYLTYKKNKALSFLDKVHTINPDVDKDFHYYYGLVLHYNDRFDDAIREYAADLQSYNPEDQHYKSVQNRISQATRAKQFKARKDAKLVKIENMGDAINTEYAEHSPVISADNDLLMFTARRPDSRGADPKHYFYDEDVYISRKVGDAWTASENVGLPINSKGHDATISLTADAQTLYIYRHKKLGGLYRTDFDAEGKAWKEPRAVEKPVNSKHYEASICQSADSSLLFFSSDRPGGYGGLDIYMARREGKDWGEPENAGPVINGPFDEDAPFLHPDGVTLYFSSEGANSIGGFDIFVTEYDSSAGAWLQPLNMGPPVNTADDEIYFVLSADGKTGYFASGREGGYGEKDIYVAKFPYFRYPKRYYALEIAGIVQDENTKDTVASTIKLIDKETGEVVEEANTDEAYVYSFIVEPERSYSLEVFSDGYDRVVDEFETPKMKDEDIVLERNILVRKPVVSAPVEKPPVLPNFQHIYFDFDKDKLRETAKQELDLVANILLNNKDMKVEVRGHTDYYGTYDYNVALSNRRTAAAVAYLEELGISPDRIVKNWFSENKPLETNSEDEGRQYNRRCEFRFINPEGRIAFASEKLRPGSEGPYVDHTKPKGKPGYDQPESTPPSMAEVKGDGSDGDGFSGQPTYAGTTPDPAAGFAGNANSSSNEAGEALPADVAALDLQHIYFDFDKSQLRDISQQQLEKVAALLKANNNYTLEIRGHTDAFGSTEYNQALSEQRSQSAWSYLQRLGVSGSRITVGGFSELQPIAENDNAGGRQSNRRVEFELRDGNRILLRSHP